METSNHNPFAQEPYPWHVSFAKCLKTYCVLICWVMWRLFKNSHICSLNRKKSPWLVLNTFGKLFFVLFFKSVLWQIDTVSDTQPHRHSGNVRSNFKCIPSINFLFRARWRREHSHGGLLTGISSLVVLVVGTHFPCLRLRSEFGQERILALFH